MVNFTIPKDLRGDYRLFINGVEVLPATGSGAGAGDVGASWRALIDAALPDFERVVKETGILKPKP
jgi:hypothetical protein